MKANLEVSKKRKEVDITPFRMCFPRKHLNLRD